MNPRDLIVSQGELDELADRLAKVADIAMSLAILASGHQGRGDSSGGRPAPHSKPPYNLGAQQVLDELCNELGTTVRHICEHRNMDVPEQCANILGQAVWLRKHRVAIGVMPDAREICDRLTKAIQRAARTSGELERTVRWTEAEKAYANRLWLTATEIEQWARQMGTDYHQLTKRRVEYLAQRIPASSRHRDPDAPKTAAWRYRAGDIIAAYDEMQSGHATSA